MEKKAKLSDFKGQKSLGEIVQYFHFNVLSIAFQKSILIFCTIYAQIIENYKL